MVSAKSRRTNGTRTGTGAGRRASARKAINVGDLRRAVAAASAAPVYLVWGAEQALRRRAYEALQSTFLGEDKDNPSAPSTPDLVRLDGTVCSLAAVLDEARSLPLFSFASTAGVDREGPTRLIWVNGCDKWGVLSTADESALERYLQDPVTDTCLVCEATKLDKRRTFYKLMVRDAVLVACDPPEREADVRRWIEATVRACGFEIDRDAVVLLLELVGRSISQLEQELEKVMLYVGEPGNIQARDFEGLLGRSREHSVFELTDALAGGSTTNAIRTLNRLLDDGEEPIRLLAMVAWVCRQLVLAGDLAGSGCAQKEAMEGLGGRWEQRRVILARATKATRGIADGRDRLLSLLRGCARADLAVKGARGPGNDGQRVARGHLETLCRQICAA